MWKKLQITRFFVGPLKSSVWGFFFLILLSGVVFMIASYAARKDNEVRLLREFSKIQDMVNNRFQVYSNSMYAVRSFVYNRPNTNLTDINQYIQDMQLFEKYPGLKAFGYAEVIAGTSLTDQAMRLSQIIPNFSPDQYSINADYYAIATTIYPYDDASNQKVLGFDLMSEVVRRRALMRSIYMDKPQISGHVKLTQDRDDIAKSTGVLFFLPIYMEKGPRHERTIQNVKGIIFITLKSSELYAAVFGDQSLDTEKVGFSVDMISDRGETTKIYDRFGDMKTKPKLTISRSFDLFGQNFKLTVYPLRSFYNLYDVGFPYIISLLTLLICALIFLNIRNNSNFATDLEKTNNLLNETLHREKEKQEDLSILNRTLQNMSHSLDIERIIDSFIFGVSEIFESKGKFAIYSTTKSHSDSPSCHLISSNDDSFFQAECKINPKIHGQLFNNREKDEATHETMDCAFLVNNPKRLYRGIFSRIDASAFGSNTFTVFISTSGDIEEADASLFKALIKHLNTSLQNTQLLKKVEDANQSKTAFLANMSHEIRTPLNALMGFSEILIRDDITQKMKTDLSTNIVKNGKQLSRLVDDILDLSKIEAGKFIIETKKVDLNELLSEIRSIMKMRLQNSPVEFKIEMEGKIPQFIQIDPLRLKQILTNLIGNSIKFTEKGMVRLRISFENEGRPLLVFRVEDTGPGIDRDFRMRLFEPFSQADTTSTRKFGGTGLGLAISKRLAKELGGDLVLIFSEKDIGSIFELTIPVDELQQSAMTDHLTLKDDEDKSTKLDEEQLKLKKILLVEDSPDNQDFFRFFLTRAGGNVKIVNNGLDAVDEAKKDAYDIILMDIQIPGIDGKEATKRIRKHGFNGPIVALTAHAMEEEQKNCIKAGCNGQISKPVSGELLISQVSNFINAGGTHATAG